MFNVNTSISNMSTAFIYTFRTIHQDLHRRSRQVPFDSDRALKSILEQFSINSPQRLQWALHPKQSRPPMSIVIICTQAKWVASEKPKHVQMTNMTCTHQQSCNLVQLHVPQEASTNKDKLDGQWIWYKVSVTSDMKIAHHFLENSVQ